MKRWTGKILCCEAKPIALAISKPTLYDRAVVDSLTRLYTKRHFLEQTRLYMAQRARLGTPLSLIILDVDRFKSVNDVHGHVAGDLVLAEVARRLKKGVRGYDLVFRYGGEEMIVLSPNTPKADAVKLAEQFGRYGYRRVTVLLRREGWRVNHKCVQRIWRQQGLNVPRLTSGSAATAREARRGPQARSAVATLR